MSLLATLGANSNKGYDPLSSPTTVIPKIKTVAPKKKATKTLAQTQAGINPYDSFNAPRPYAPGTIDSTATSQYNADVANATKLAGMGYLTPEQIDAQSKNRADQQTALAASLAAALGGIQQVQVGSGNAGSAGLGQTNAQTLAGAGGIAGAPATASAPTPAVQGVLAAQTAGTGNIYGGYQAAALSSGDQAAKAAYATGDTTKQTNAADQAKALASILSGVSSISTREAGMVDANSKVDTANTATHLAIWTGIEQRRLQAQAMGDKKGEAAAALQERQYEAGLSSQDRRYATEVGATTSRGNAQLSADTSLARTKMTVDAAKQRALITAAAKRATASGTKPPSASQKLALNKQINKLMTTQGGTKGAPGQVTTGYTVTLDPGPDALPGTKPNTITVDAKTGAALKAGGTYGVTGQRVNAVAPKTKTGAATVVNAPSSWTKWKRAHAAVMTTLGMNRTEATQYMAASGWPAPKS